MRLLQFNRNTIFRIPVFFNYSRPVVFINKAITKYSFMRIFSTLKINKSAANKETELWKQHVHFSRVERLKYYTASVMGLTIKGVAKRLFISLETVRKHLRNMCKKADAKNTLHLFAKVFLENGPLPKDARLARKEMEILNLLAGGATTKEIADLLRISSATIRTHRQNIREKLNVSNSRAVFARILEQNK